MTLTHFLSPKGWHELQRQQFWHDEKFHREISRLSTQDRLRHMTLHFAKYAGALHQPSETADTTRLLVDTFIIAVSTANILNLRLGEAHLEELDDQRNLPFEVQLSIAAGSMAAACEKLDHLEAFPYREKLIEGTKRILNAVLAESARRNLDLVHATEKRLHDVKQKSLFFSDLVD